MKRLLFLLCCSLLFFGCNKPQPAANTELPAEASNPIPEAWQDSDANPESNSDDSYNSDDSEDLDAFHDSHSQKPYVPKQRKTNHTPAAGEAILSAGADTSPNLPEPSHGGQQEVKPKPPEDTPAKNDLSKFTLGLRTTQQHENYETQRFTVDIEDGCTVPVNLDALLTQCLEFTEELTGMSLDTEYAEAHYADKITIYISKASGNAVSGGSLCLNQESTLLYGGCMYQLVQSYARCLILRNGPALDELLSAGYSLYISDLAEEAAYLPYLYDTAASYNYYGYELDITAENAETLFQSLSDWESEIYGYRFVSYLHDQYGDDFYLRLLEKAQEKEIGETQFTAAQMTEILKETAGADVFENFAVWHSANIDYFTATANLSNVSNFSRIVLFPLEIGGTEFSGTNLLIADGLTIDFSIWKEYAAAQYNMKPTSLQGTLYIMGDGSIDFYNSRNELLQSIPSYQWINISLEDVDYIKITGKDLQFFYNFQFALSFGDEIVPITPIAETHTGGKCDLSEYAVGFKTVQQTERYQTERFLVEIEAGCTVPVNLDALLLNCIAFTESLTGLSLDSEYGKAQFGEKITFHIAADASPCGNGSGVWLTPDDVVFYDGNMWVPVHELTHTLDYRNGADWNTMNPVLTEGHSTYITKIAGEQSSLPYLFSADCNYAAYEQEITAENAEDLFKTLSDWDAYLYGYRLSCFLHERYGSDIYPRILERTREENLSGEGLTPEQQSEVLKAVTEEKIFENFALWYNESPDRFNQSGFVADTRQFSRISLFATFLGTGEFLGSLRVEDTLTVDLSTFREHAFMQRGLITTRLHGGLGIIGTATLDFYDSHNNLIDSRIAADEYIYVSLEDVNFIQVTGLDISILYNFIYDDSSEPSSGGDVSGGDVSGGDVSGGDVSGSDAEIVPVTPIAEIHTDGKCDLSEYTAGFRTTQQTERYETERFFVEIEAGCTVPVNLDALLLNCLTFTEILTGLSLDAEYGKARYGEKITIYILTGIIPMADGNAVYLTPDTVIFYDGGMWLPVHELTHTLDLRNGASYYRLLLEGSSMYMTKLAQEQAYLPYLYSAADTAAIYEQICGQETTVENAEDLFKTVSGDDAYLYGYRFFCFLHERYGDTVYLRILEESKTASLSGKELTPQQQCELIKSVTGETVFEDFAVWFSENSDRFNQLQHAPYATDRFSRIALFGTGMNAGEFSSSFSYLHVQDTLTVDLKPFREYTSMQLGLVPNTLQGTFTVTGTGTLDFYDSQDSLIQSWAAADETISVSLQDVNSIQISGLDLTLEYYFTYME